MFGLPAFPPPTPDNVRFAGILIFTLSVTVAVTPVTSRRWPAYGGGRFTPRYARALSVTCLTGSRKCNPDEEIRSRIVVLTPSKSGHSIEGSGTGVTSPCAKILAEQTLRNRDRAWHERRLGPVPRGRPAQRSSVIVRNEIIDALRRLGPRTSIATLAQRFPTVAKAELRELRVRFRRVADYLVLRLRWLQPGTVWVADHTQLDAPIDGKYKFLLAVRDLASGKVLATVPTASPDTAPVVETFTGLFATFGAPSSSRPTTAARSYPTRCSLYFEARA